MVATPAWSIGSARRSSKGAAGQTVGQETILAANTSYLFIITNLDTLAADITSYISWYEGPIDLPVT